MSKMSVLFYDDVMFCEGKMRNIMNNDVFLTNMRIHPEVIQFDGVTKRVGNVYKVSAGFHYEIPISQIIKVYKAKARMVHLAAIETQNGQIFNLVKVDNSSLLGKKYADALVEILNKSLITTRYCANCGNLAGPSDKFCKNCGEKL